MYYYAASGFNGTQLSMRGVCPARMHCLCRSYSVSPPLRALLSTRHYVSGFDTKLSALFALMVGFLFTSSDQKNGFFFLHAKVAPALYIARFCSLFHFDVVTILLAYLSFYWFTGFTVLVFYCSYLLAHLLIY